MGSELKGAEKKFLQRTVVQKVSRIVSAQNSTSAAIQLLSHDHCLDYECAFHCYPKFSVGIFCCFNLDWFGMPFYCKKIVKYFQIMEPCNGDGFHVGVYTVFIDLLASKRSMEIQGLFFMNQEIYE